jgi:hypothetical protein
MAFLDTVLQLQRWDQRRDSVPGEHWAAVGTGLTVLRWGLKRRSPVLKLVGCAAGAAMMVRGLSGRDGALAKLKGSKAAVPPGPPTGR